MGLPAAAAPSLPLSPLRASPAAGWLPPELKPRTQRPWKTWVCQPPPAGRGPSTSGLSEQIWTVLKWRRKSCSSILESGRKSPLPTPRSHGPQIPQVLPSTLQTTNQYVSRMTPKSLSPPAPPDFSESSEMPHK